MKPYFQQGGIAIYHGDCREVLPALALRDVGCVIADPPYNETSLDWDRWPEGWPGVVAAAVPAAVPLWCFGSLRMFLDRRDDFSAWKFAQEIVWEKHNGSSFADDRFKRVHELVAQWYRGPWGDVWRSPQYTNDATARQVRRKRRPIHMGAIGDSTYTSEDGGPRLMRSVLRVRSCHGSATNPTQKPEGLVEPLLRYSAPPDRIVVDVFLGSGTTLDVAKSLGLRAVGIDIRESECESAAKRLIQTIAFPSAPAGAA